MRRDTVGSAGTARRMSKPVFGPPMVSTSGIQVKQILARVARLLDQETGMHKFPSIPKIRNKMWRLVQEFDISRLILTEIERNPRDKLLPPAR